MFLEWDDNVDATIPNTKSATNTTVVNANDSFQEGNHTKHHFSLNAFQGVQGVCIIQFKANIMGLDI